MKDSPRPMSWPVSARRKNRSSWTDRVASRTSPVAEPVRAVGALHGQRSAGQRRARPERNAVFAHCVTMLIAPSTNRSDRPFPVRMAARSPTPSARDARHDGHAFPPQFQRLPVNPGHRRCAVIAGYRTSARRISSRVPGPALERQRRIEARPSRPDWSPCAPPGCPPAA